MEGRKLFIVLVSIFAAYVLSAILIVSVLGMLMGSIGPVELTIGVLLAVALALLVGWRQYTRALGPRHPAMQA